MARACRMVSIYHFAEYYVYIVLIYVCNSISAAFICVTAAGLVQVVY